MKKDSKKNYFDREKNQKERFEFIEKWADYVRTHSDEDWSKQQKILIDSQIKNAKKQIIGLKDYLALKNSNKSVVQLQSKDLKQ